MGKENIKIVVAGHLDHGKSTLIGRLLFETKSLPKNKIAELKTICRLLKKEVEFAYLTDQLEEERERNATIDTTQVFLKTSSQSYTLIDVPGHLKFIKNMLTGMSSADIALLVIDAQTGIKKQTIRHLALLAMFGIRRCMIAINKMDLVGYRKGRYEICREDLKTLLYKIKMQPLCFVPLSAKRGDNLCKKSKNMKWYHGQTLLDNFKRADVHKQNTERYLQLPVQDVYDKNGNKIIVGRIASGIARQKQKIVILPASQTARIKNIIVSGKNQIRARQGENVGFVINKKTPVLRGNMIVSRHAIISPALRFQARIFCLAEQRLAPGKRLTLRCATQKTTCTIEKIIHTIDAATLVRHLNTKAIGKNEIGEISIKTQSPLCCEPFTGNNELGRFMLFSGRAVCGLGVVTKLCPKKESRP